MKFIPNMKVQGFEIERGDVIFIMGFSYEVDSVGPTFVRKTLRDGKPMIRFDLINTDTGELRNLNVGFHDYLEIIR